MEQQQMGLLKDKRVLLVENDEVNQMLIGYMIDDSGGKQVLNTTAKQVLENLNNNKPELILLNMAIDGVNALEFTQRLRKEMDVQVPIIGMSSQNLNGRGIFHGLDAVIRKPVEYPEFKRVLAEVLS